MKKLSYSSPYTMGTNTSYSGSLTAVKPDEYNRKCLVTTGIATNTSKYTFSNSINIKAENNIQIHHMEILSHIHNH